MIREKCLVFLHRLLLFAYYQATSCIFPAFIFLILAVSRDFSIPYLYRYDLILLACIFVQIAMVKTGLETKDELKVITIFHLIGFLLETFKVHMGSWTYSEEAWSKIFGVPLYSGFMYASVASYMIQAWRRLKVQLHGWPSYWMTISLGLLIYLNFFTHHFIFDLRWILFGLLFVAFYRSYVIFVLNSSIYHMPLVLSFLLIGFFVWIAENIATFFGAWQYPNQTGQWEMVDLNKISSWSLLVIVSFIIVAQLKHIKGKHQRRKETNQKIIDLV